LSGKDLKQKGQGAWLKCSNIEVLISKPHYCGVGEVLKKKKPLRRVKVPILAKEREHAFSRDRKNAMRQTNKKPQESTDCDFAISTLSPRDTGELDPK
jgi:hypothetical protein